MVGATATGVPGGSNGSRSTMVRSVSLDVMPPLMVSRRAGEASVHANPSASPGSDSRVAGHTVADVVGSAGDVDEVSGFADIQA
ncbi:hypothetical protein V6N13_049089 [Hibiscus sabdariffa]